MLYCLLGKVFWNNEFGSNLLCKCNKREGVQCNDDHVCMLMTDEEHQAYFTIARQVYDRYFVNNPEMTVQEAEKEINQWAAKNNKGINGKTVFCVTYLCGFILFNFI